MNRLRLAAAFVPVVALLVLAAPAFAHNVSVSPRYGEVGDDFVFRGKAWQPFKRVRWYYDESNDGSFERRGSFVLRSSGNFRFRWTGEDTADTHRMCFRQFDSRPRFQRFFTKCRRFTAFPV